MINTNPFALIDLFNHVISGRANVGEIDALIEYLQRRRRDFTEDELRESLKNLLAWIPEMSKPSDYAELTGWEIEDAKDGDGSPFVSEAFLYIVLGKDDARTFLSRVGKVIEAAGYDMFELESEINRAKWLEASEGESG